MVGNDFLGGTNGMQRELAFIEWWGKEAIKMNSTLDKFTARIAFYGGYRFASQNSAKADAKNNVCQINLDIGGTK